MYIVLWDNHFWRQWFFSKIFQKMSTENLNLVCYIRLCYEHTRFKFSLDIFWKLLEKNHCLQKWLSHNTIDGISLKNRRSVTNDSFCTYIGGNEWLIFVLTLVVSYFLFNMKSFEVLSVFENLKILKIKIWTFS